MTHWKVIDGSVGLWSNVQLVDGVPFFRAVAVALRGGDLAVVSPIRGTSMAALEELESLGRPTVLLAPNHFHHFGLGSFRQRYPQCVVVASSGAAPRVSKKAACTVGGLETLRQKLPDHLRLLEPPGMRTGEVWVHAQSERGVIWCVGDAFFNFPRAPRTAAGLFARLARIAPGLRISPIFKLVGLRDRQSYGHWLVERLDADEPIMVVPAHGDVLDGTDLTERLRAVVHRRLRLA